MSPPLEGGCQCGAARLFNQREPTPDGVRAFDRNPG